MTVAMRSISFIEASRRPRRDWLRLRPKLQGNGGGRGIFSSQRGVFRPSILSPLSDVKFRARPTSDREAVPTPIWLTRRREESPGPDLWFGGIRRKGRLTQTFLNISRLRFLWSPMTWAHGQVSPRRDGDLSDAHPARVESPMPGTGIASIAAKAPEAIVCCHPSQH